MFRSEIRTEAEDRFIILKDKLPFLCNVSSIVSMLFYIVVLSSWNVIVFNSMFLVAFQSLGVIQKYCTVLQDNPSWNICHLIVYFNLIDAITKPEAVR